MHLPLATGSLHLPPPPPPPPPPSSPPLHPAPCHPRHQGPQGGQRGTAWRGVAGGRQGALRTQEGRENHCNAIRHGQHANAYNITILYVEYYTSEALPGSLNGPSCTGTNGPASPHMPKLLGLGGKAWTTLELGVHSPPGLTVERGAARSICLAGWWVPPASPDPPRPPGWVDSC